MNIPPDLNDPNDPNAPAPLDPNADFALKKPGSKTPWIIVGVIAVAVIGFFVYRSMQAQKIREMHVGVMKQFQEVEKQQVIGKFWACLLGAGVDPGMFQNNLALAQRLEGAFSVDPKNYPTKVREECTPLAIDAKHQIESISAPAMYDAPLKAYAKSLSDLSAAFDSWSKVAPAHLAEREVGAKVGTDGAAWHAFAGGKPAPEVVVYDRFLHCAVPGVDKMKDGQELVEYLFKQCKDPKYLDHLQAVCGKDVTTEGVAPDGDARVQDRAQEDRRPMTASSPRSTTACARAARASAATTPKRSAAPGSSTWKPAARSARSARTR